MEDLKDYRWEAAVPYQPSLSIAHARVSGASWWFGGGGGGAAFVDKSRLRLDVSDYSIKLIVIQITYTIN